MPTYVSRHPFRRAEAGGPLTHRLDARLEALSRDEALRILSGAAAILDHAEREGVRHGDLGAEFVTVSADAVAIAGFGEPRSTTRAPEGRPQGTGTDRYGLGVLAVQCLCRTLERPRLDEDGPEDAVRPIPDLFGGEEDAQVLTIEIVDLLRPEPGERPDPLRLQAAVIGFSLEGIEEAAPEGLAAPPAPAPIAPVPLAVIAGVAVTLVLVAFALASWAFAG